MAVRIGVVALERLAATPARLRLADMDLVHLLGRQELRSLVEQAGFEAVYMTGNGVSASLLGRPDVGLADLTLITSHARRVAACVGIPLICDADTGYGNAVNVRHTVQEFESAGVAAIHIEDQVSPKRCGQLPGARPVIELREAVGKIRTDGAWPHPSGPYRHRFVSARSVRE